MEGVTDHKGGRYAKSAKGGKDQHDYNDKVEVWCNFEAQEI